MPEIILRIGPGIGSSNRIEKRSIHFEDSPSVTQLMQFLSDYYGKDLANANIVTVINGKMVQENERHARTVENGDIVSIFSAIAGG